MKEFIFPWGTIKVPYEDGKDCPAIYGCDATSSFDINETDTFEVTLLREAKEYFSPQKEVFYIAILHPTQFKHLECFVPKEWPFPLQRIADMQMSLCDNILIFSHPDIEVYHWGSQSRVKVLVAEAIFMGGSGQNIVLLRTAI